MSAPFIDGRAVHLCKHWRINDFTSVDVSRNPSQCRLNGPELGVENSSCAESSNIARLALSYLFTNQMRRGYDRDD